LRFPSDADEFCTYSGIRGVFCSDSTPLLIEVFGDLVAIGALGVDIEYEFTTIFRARKRVFLVRTLFG